MTQDIPKGGLEEINFRTYYHKNEPKNCLTQYETIVHINSLSL